MDSELETQPKDSTMKTQSSVPVARRNVWLKVLSTAAVFYIVLLAILLLTVNPVMFPTVVMVGNFMVPVAFVVFLYERRYLSRLTSQTVSLAFLYGGLVGVIAASILWALFIKNLDLVSTLKIGFIEELAKILGVVVIVRHKWHDSEMDGLILGAAVGMGFAALESNGYAFAAFLESKGSISSVVEITLFRGLLSPMMHGTWTAILASVLFRESRDSRFLINLQVIGAYIFVSILHSIWNAANMVLELGILIALGMIGITGLFVLRLCWLDAVRLQTVMPPEMKDT
jgi:RsiW-degrading membrane proteinase PrsW (M82 family)